MFLQVVSELVVRHAERSGGGDAFDVNSTNVGSLTFTTISADTIDSQTEAEARAFVVTGEAIGSAQTLVYMKFPSDSGYAGFIFGYKSANDYWMYVLDAGADKKYIYHVVDGDKGTAVAEYVYTIGAGTWCYAYNYSKRGSMQRWPSYTFTDGFPSGKVGLVTNADEMEFSYVRVPDDALWANTLGRWMNNTVNSAVTTTGGDRLYGGNTWDAADSPKLLKNVRLEKFQATFSFAKGSADTGDRYLRFVFHAKDQDDFDYLELYHYNTKTAPQAFTHDDGGYRVIDGAATRTAANMPDLTTDTDPLWVRVEFDGTNLTVKGATSEGGLSSASGCFTTTAFSGNGGGRFGFAYGIGYFDDLTIKRRNDADDGWESDPEVVEGFELDGGNFGENENLVHDAAGNLTYDGRHKYTYDAWNRMIAVTRAYRTSGGTLTDGSQTGTITYDGLGRRTTKAIANAGDWDATYEFYYSGQSMIETRNGSTDVLKQHVWGRTYIDELCQIGVNTDPADAGEDDCEDFYYTLQDANYNVLALVDDAGNLIERYEYTPYGQRTIFRSAGSNDLLCMSSSLDSRRVAVAGVDQPYSLCDIGHQGLMHDKEFALIYNRRRYLEPIFGRFTGPDPLNQNLPGGGYHDGMSLYEYVGSRPLGSRDPDGLAEPGDRNQPDLSGIFGHEGVYVPSMMELGEKIKKEKRDAIKAPGFKLCRRDFANPDLVEMLINWVSIGQHQYVAYGDQTSNKERWGRGWGGEGMPKGSLSVEETYFHPTRCAPCKKSDRCLSYGAKKKASKATDAEIKTCLEKHPASEDFSYNPFSWYVCKTWAAEAAYACGLDCPSP